MVKKVRSKTGFTLIEMLIVVALIAILVAISIPLVGKALQRSQVATDMANERGCKAAVTTKLASKVDALEGLSDPAKYDAVAGKLVTNSTAVVGYGKCKTHEGGYLIVDKNGDQYDVYWSTTNKGVHKEEGKIDDFTATDILVIKPGD